MTVSPTARYQDARFVGYAAEDYAPLSFDRPEWISHIPKEVTLDSPIDGRAGAGSPQHGL